jgi:hypothetical protein
MKKGGDDAGGAGDAKGPMKMTTTYHLTAGGSVLQETSTGVRPMRW